MISFFYKTHFISLTLLGKIYNSAKRGNNNIGLPEFRTYLMMPASTLVPIGLLIYGWTANYHFHPIFPNIGIVIFSSGLIVTYQCIQAYTLDCYPTYAASAIGSLTFLRSVAGLSFPMIGPVLYQRLGYGWGASILAVVAAVLGCAAPWLLYSKGPALRAKSSYATGEE